MEYIEKNLLEHEKLIYAVRPHWVIFSSAVWTAIFALIIWIKAPAVLSLQIFPNWPTYEVVAAALAMIATCWGINAYIRYTTSEYGVTNKRVLIKVGWIQRRSLEILVEKVEGVSVDQTVMGRILNYGWITIIGTGGTNDRFPFIPDPLLFRKTVQQQIENLEESFMRPPTAKD